MSAFTVGQVVRHDGLGTDWCPTVKDGYEGTVVKVYKNGNVAVRFTRAGLWLRQSYAAMVFHFKAGALRAA